MKRRDFLATTGISLAAATAAEGEGSVLGGSRHYLEWREYQLLPGDGRKAFHEFLEGVALPAARRAGTGPIGVFQTQYGPSKPSVTILIPHVSLESVATFADRLADDAQFLRDGASFLGAELSHPNYVRMESSLMVAFAGMPRVEVPPQHEAGQKRIFELRVYESHSSRAAKKKIEMFNDGGEIEIFRRTGLQPVFFGETIIGSRMPNLTYMLVFDDMVARDAAWDRFRNDAGWKTLSADPQYKDTVSNITDYILTPLEYSQI
ncbi:MAG: NIPSNAP family protein [Pirellulaceae bacterium]|nr:NIPSNAP family protein [Planctomycetales bacterium]